MLNKQGEGKISWCDFSWNPIAGCQHGCDYCYCNRLAKRYNKDFTFYVFRDHYFRDLKSKKLKKGDKIFVGSSGDMWGDWVPYFHIEKVLNEIKKYPQYIFQFLTKNPKRYAEFDFPKNCWLGYTIDTMNRYNQYKNETKNMMFPNNKYFVSFEPLLEKIDSKFLEKSTNIDWIIIGANSNSGSEKPSDEWADNIIDRAKYLNIPVWVKNNYGFHSILKEFPK
jgi:protein gp37